MAGQGEVGPRKGRVRIPDLDTVGGHGAPFRTKAFTVAFDGSVAAIKSPPTGNTDHSTPEVLHRVLGVIHHPEFNLTQ